MDSKKALKKVLEIAIYIGVAYFVYTKLEGNFRSLGDSAITVNWSRIFIAIAIFALHNIYNGFNWHYMMASSGEKLSYDSQVRVYLKSYILRYIPGNIVGIMARAVYNKEYGVASVKSLWGWFFENIIYLGLGITLGLNVLLLLADYGSLSLPIIALALGVGVFFVVKNDILKLLFSKTLIKKLPKKAQKEFEVLDIPLQSRVSLLLRYFLSWGIYSLSYVVAVSAVVDVSVSQLVLLASTNALAYSIGYLSLVTPSGAGVRESVMISALTSVVGLENSISVIIAVLARIVFIGGELIGFASYMIYSRFIPNE